MNARKGDDGAKPGETGTLISVVICDDAALNSECLALALASHRMAVDRVGDLPALLSRLEHDLPDVILLNADMQDSDTMRHIALDAGPEVRVIVTGLSEERESDIVSCAEAGVAGLHLRTESLAELMTLIVNPAEDEALCSKRISAILVRQVYSLVEQRTNDPESKPTLTEREIQIMRLIGEGLSNQQIATRLSVTIHTVKNHAHSLFGKLGVGSRADAVAAYRALRYSDATRP